MDALIAPVREFLGPAWLPVWTLVKIVVLGVPLILGVAYLTLAERKVIGYMQVRIGPNRVGPLGLLQPFADVFKLIFKEIIVPTGANRTLFFIAPMLAIGPAVAAWAVVPLTDTLVIADVNAGLLYLLAMTSMGVYGIILAGWASNSKYAFLGALRSAAHSSVQQIQSSGELVKLAVSDALQTESALGSIAAAVSLIQQMNQQIAAAAEEQSSVAEEINRSVTSIRASADQSSIAMRGNAASSIELAQLGSELRGMVGHFRL